MSHFGHLVEIWPKHHVFYRVLDGYESTRFDQALAARAGVAMTIFTDRELEFLAGLRTNWGKLYLREVARLLNGADNKCAGPNVLRTSGNEDAKVIHI